MNGHARLTTRIPAVVLVAASVAALALLATRADFVPIWDGHAFADCAMTAAEHGVSPGYLQCFGHPSFASMGLLALTQLLAPGSALILFAAHAGLVAVAAICFHRILRGAFPSPDHAVERALLTSALILQPSLLGNILQPSLDVAVFAAFVVCLALILERRWIATAAAGTVLVFCKETGALLYALLVGCYVWWFVLRQSEGTVPLRRRLSPLSPLLVPLMLFATYLALYLLFLPDQYPLFQSAEGTSLLREFVVPRLDSYLAADLTLIFVLNFSWIPAAGMIAGGVAQLARRLRGHARVGRVDAEGSMVSFILLLLVATSFFLTRFRTFSHVRYFFCAIPLLLPLFYAALLRLRVPAGPRRAAIGFYVGVLLLSSMRTVDPLARAIFGTFDFGSHAMLRPTSLTGECCDDGRDGLVYNLQFTHLNTLLNDVFAAFPQADSSVVVLPFEANWRVVGRLDRGSGRRTLKRKDVVRPTTLDHRQFLERVPLPDQALFIALPTSDNARALRELAARYAVVEQRRFERKGYWIDAYRLTRTPGSQ